jgi:hypothetical protein
MGVAEAVRRVVAVQGQQAASPYVALWNRVQDFDPQELDEAFADRSVVKATLMRITLHAVHGEDYPAFRDAVEPTLRAAGLNDRFQASGLTVEDADELVPELVNFAKNPRTVPEIAGWLEERLGVPAHPGAVRGLRMYSPLLHSPTGGPWSFGHRPSYFAAPPTQGAPADGLKVLVRRYLEGFGPASVADVAQFAMVPRARAKVAVQALELEELKGPDGTVLYDIPNSDRPDEDTPAPPRLMAMWDSVLLAYSDRSRVIPPEYRKVVTRINGDVLPTLLVDGYVAGVWRAVDGGIEATAFHPLDDDTWEGLAAEARSLTELLRQREQQVYSRYNNWWKKLPSGDVRVLA